MQIEVAVYHWNHAGTGLAVLTIHSLIGSSWNSFPRVYHLRKLLMDLISNHNELLNQILCE